MKNVIEIEEVLETELVEVGQAHPMAVEQKNKLEVKREILDWGQLMEMSAMLAKSTIIPVQYQNRPENIMIALDLSSRLGVSPIMTMQNLHVIQGKPSLSGQFIASLIKSSDQFKDVELHFVGEEGKDTWGAYVTAIKRSTGTNLKGATVTIATAKKEGWMTRPNSKWVSMPEIMLSYRAFAWFGRVYAPELLNGLHSTDEVEDFMRETEVVKNPYEKK